MEKETVLVGLSGGVDSAATAVLLKAQGYNVIGATMTVWDPSLPIPKEEYKKNACLSPEKEDVAEVKAIAEKIGIKHIVVDCKEQYKKVVLDNFRLEYSCGRTPNPCVLCNSFIKFGVLPTAALKQGIHFDKFATGHYARISFDKERGLYLLRKSVDLSRDQSYFLHRLNQTQLKHVLFPLGEKTKKEIREIARQAGLAVADKEDSQDFYCGDYNDLLNFPNKPGEIVTKEGKIVAKHNGIWGYTIGKRKGLGISGLAVPMYVVGINAEKNQVIIGPKKDLYSSSLLADNVSWITGQAPAKDFDCEIKIRNLHLPAKAHVTVKENNRIEVNFVDPQLSITSGQSAVMYDGDVVLGGGIIC